MTAIVGPDGEIILAREILNALGVQPGWRALQRLEGDRLIVEFRPPKHNRSLAGILAGKAKRTFPTEEELDAAIEEAWTHRAREIAGLEEAE